MRWIDRGPEPDEVDQYADRYTQGWVDYFQNRAGERPTDFLWTLFRTTLGHQSNGNCWYCERQCNPEVAGRDATVDHFRPISLFPHLAYAWSNWIFSCQGCNAEKGNKWPDSEYVDPCASVATERPAQYLDYDADTGEIIHKEGLSESARRKGLNTIHDLGLNRLDVRFYRLQWTRQFLTDLLSLPVSERLAFAQFITQQPVEYAGVTGMVVEQLQLNGII